MKERQGFVSNSSSSSFVVVVVVGACLEKPKDKSYDAWYEEIVHKLWPDCIPPEDIEYPTDYYADILYGGVGDTKQELQVIVDGEAGKIYIGKNIALASDYTLDESATTIKEIIEIESKVRSVLGEKTEVNLYTGTMAS